MGCPRFQCLQIVEMGSRISGMDGEGGTRPRRQSAVSIPGAVAEHMIVGEFAAHDQFIQKCIPIRVAARIGFRNGQSHPDRRYLAVLQVRRQPRDVFGLRMATRSGVIRQSLTQEPLQGPAAVDPPGKKRLTVASERPTSSSAQRASRSASASPVTGGPTRACRGHAGNACRCSDNRRFRRGRRVRAATSTRRLATSAGTTSSVSTCHTAQAASRATCSRQLAKGGR